MSVLWIDLDCTRLPVGMEGGVRSSAPRARGTDTPRRYDSPPPEPTSIRSLHADGLHEDIILPYQAH